MAGSPGGSARYIGYILAQVQEQIPGIVAGQVANQMASQLGEIQTAIGQLKHRMDTADAALNQQVKLIQASTGSILQENLKKANDGVELLQAKINMAGTIAEDSQKRIDQLIKNVNSKYEAIEAEQKKMEGFSESRVASLELKFNELESRCQIEFTSQIHKIESIAAFVQECQKHITATGVAGGAGTGRGSTTTTKLTTKDVKVEKLVEKADVAEFRRWQRMIELQLENVFGKTHIEDLIMGIRHQRSPITSTSWDELLAKLNGDGEGHMF